MAAQWVLQEQIRRFLEDGTQGNNVTLPREDSLGWAPEGAAEVGRQVSVDMYLRPGNTAGLSSIYKSTSRVCSIMSAMTAAKAKFTWQIPLARSWLDPPTRNDDYSCANSFHVGRPKPDRGIPNRDILDLDDSRVCLIAVRQTWQQVNQLGQLISQLLDDTKAPSELNLRDLIHDIRTLTNQPHFDLWLRAQWMNQNPTTNQITGTQADGIGLAQLLNMYDYTKLSMKFVRIGLEAFQSALIPLQPAVDGYLQALKNVQASVMAGDAFSTDLALNEMVGALANLNGVWDVLIKPDVTHCVAYRWPAVQPATRGAYIYRRDQNGYSGISALVTPQHIIVATGIGHIELQQGGCMIGLYHVFGEPPVPHLAQHTGMWASYDGEAVGNYHYPQNLTSVHLALHESAMSGVQFGRSTHVPGRPGDWTEGDPPINVGRNEFQIDYRTRMRFPRSFSKPPFVSAWIMGYTTSDRYSDVQIPCPTTMRVSVGATSEEWFECLVRLSACHPQNGSYPGRFEIGWIAIEGGQHDHEMYLNTVDLKGETKGNAGTRVDFVPGYFKVAPTVWCGLNYIRCFGNNVVAVSASRTSSFGTYVNFQTWWDCTVMECCATVLAVGQKFASFEI